MLNCLKIFLSYFIKIRKKQWNDRYRMIDSEFYNYMAPLLCLY